MYVAIVHYYNVICYSLSSIKSYNKLYSDFYINRINLIEIKNG